MQTTLNNFSIFDEILSNISAISDIVITEKGVLHANIKSCPLCSSSLSLNGYNLTTDRRAKMFGLSFKKGKLVCSNRDCGYSHSTPQAVFKGWFSSFSEYIESTILSLKIKKLSPKDIADHIEKTLQFAISEDFVRDKIKDIMKNIKKPFPQDIPSKVIAHDEQFVTIKGIELKRISVIDANNPNVYYDDLHNDRTEETITEVCKKIKEEINDLYAAVIDGHIAAHNAYAKTFWGILIQFCLFHFAMNVREAYKEEVGYGQGNACIPLEHLIGFFSIMNIFFDHEREIQQLRIFQKQLNENIERVNKEFYSLEKKQEYITDYKKKYDKKVAEYLHEIRKARRRKNGIELTLRTEEQAKFLLEKAKLENIFPKKVQKQIKRLEKDWLNFTHCLRDNKIPPTSNKIEQYYATTLNWVEKNNLQSREQFYEHQKIAFLKRYRIPLFREGIFTDFMRKTFVLLRTFGT